MAFHSPVMSVIHDELEAFIAPIPFHSPQIPVISNTTMAPYPSDPEEIRRILMAHLESPVHWMNNVQTLWNDFGVRLFVEIGPGDILSNLIADTIPDPACIPTCLPRAESWTCKTALAQLFVQGHLKGQRAGSLAAGLTAPLPMETPAAGEAPGNPDHMERLIQIIMDATGFERDEIRPEMDLRRDLSIRSSRLPIIMDAAERDFAITIELQDFIHVRTVKDIAQRISEIIARQEGSGLHPAARALDPEAVRKDVPKPSEGAATLKRIVFDTVPIDLSASLPIKWEPGDAVLLLSSEGYEGVTASVGDIFRLDHGADILMQGCFSPGEAGHDIRTAEGAGKAADKIAGHPSLRGMVITLHPAESLNSMADISRFLKGLFILLKAFLEAPERKFVVLIHSREDTETPVRLLVEGMLGLFLSAAQEYPAVQFRTLEIGRDTDLRAALRAALDKGYTPVEMALREEKVFTSEGHIAPLPFQDPSRLHLSPGDVVVISGGATGIGAHLARALSPFKPFPPPHCIRLRRLSLSKTGPWKLPGLWRSCTPQESRPPTIPVM
jgi:malonyl CoA-acyl carrier protein transacylase